MINLKPDSRYLKAKAGFTLIEFLVVAALLILLSSIVMLGYTQTSKTARDKQREKDIHVVRVALEQYYETYKSYPNASSIDDLLNNANFTEFLQESTVRDPINTGVYRYTATSSTAGYQLSYTRESDQVQVVVNNL